MSNIELFSKAMVAGAGFMAGAASIIFVGLVLAVIIGCIVQEEKEGKK